MRSFSSLSCLVVAALNTDEILHYLWLAADDENMVVVVTV